MPKDFKEHLEGKEISKINIFAIREGHNKIPYAKIFYLPKGSKSFSLKNISVDEYSRIYNLLILPALELGLASKIEICNPEESAFEMHKSNFYTELPYDTVQCLQASINKFVDKVA